MLLIHLYTHIQDNTHTTSNFDSQFESVDLSMTIPPVRTDYFSIYEILKY